MKEKPSHFDKFIDSTNFYYTKFGFFIILFIGVMETISNNQNSIFTKFNNSIININNIINLNDVIYLKIILLFAIAGAIGFIISISMEMIFFIFEQFILKIVSRKFPNFSKLMGFNFDNKTIHYFYKKIVKKEYAMIKVFKKKNFNYEYPYLVNYLKINHYDLFKDFNGKLKFLSITRDIISITIVISINYTLDSILIEIPINMIMISLVYIFFKPLIITDLIIKLDYLKHDIDNKPEERNKAIDSD